MYRQPTNILVVSAPEILRSSETARCRVPYPGGEPAGPTNIFNTDRRLQAIETLADTPSPIQQTINIIDDVAGTFTFPRLPVLVRQ